MTAFEKKRIFFFPFWMLLLFFFMCAGKVYGQEEQLIYIENEYNFVDQAMDISGGIPEYAEGVLADIREAGVLRVATEPYFPPWEFVDESLEGQDRYVGADMELARRIAERMGVELSIIPMEFSDLLTAPAQGSCDLVISGLSYTPGRAVQAELSKSYHKQKELGSVVLIRKWDRDEILELPDLENKVIVAQKGSLQEAQAADHILNYLEFWRTQTVEEVYHAVAEYEADAAVVDYESAQNYVRNNRQLGLKIVPSIMFVMEEQFEGERVAAKKGELQLMYFVNGVIDELMESGEYQEWFQDYEDYARRLGL